VRWLISAAEFVLGLVILATVVASVARTALVPGGRSSRMVRGSLRLALGTGRLAVRIGGCERVRPRAADMIGPAALLVVLLGWLFGLLNGFVLLAVSVGGVRTNVDALAGQFLRTGPEQASRLGQAVVVGSWAAMGTAIACFAGYLSTIAAAYGRRERGVRRLASQAVRPPDAESMLAGYLRAGPRGIDPLLAEWDRWFSDVRTTHSAYPVLITLPASGSLCWLQAMVIALDTAALVDALMPTTASPAARGLLRSGTACLHELADRLRVPVRTPVVSLQGREESDFPDTVKTALRAGLTVERDEQHAWRAFQSWRQAYAPHASAIAAHLLCYCPPAETATAAGRSHVR
jgi:hypothetical protein